MRDNIKMSQYFFELLERSVGNVKVELDLSNNSMKVNLKRGKDIDTSSMASKTGLAGFKNKSR